MSFLPKDVKCSINGTAILDVTTQSEMDFTFALVLAYTTTSLSLLSLQNFLN